MSDLKQPFGDYNPAPAESVPLPRLRAPRWTTALLASAATVALGCLV